MKEIGRADSLFKAIESARHALLDQELQSIGEGLHAEREIRMQPHYENS